MKRENRLVNVASCRDVIEANLFRSRLEVEGIQAYISDEHVVSMQWTLSNAVGGVKVLVKESDEELAVEIIGHIIHGDFKIEEQDEMVSVTCPNCNSKNVAERLGGWKTALLALILVSIPTPFTRGKYKCLDCNHKWRTR